MFLRFRPGHMSSKQHAELPSGAKTLLGICVCLCMASTIAVDMYTSVHNVPKIELSTEAWHIHQKN